LQDSCVFHRRLDRALPKAVRAEGVWIHDDQGKKYLDASGGPICVNVGHGRSEVAEAMAKQAKQLAYVHGPMFTSDPVESLARRLAVHTPEPIDRFYFCSSGCEAVETAIKLARQIHVARGEPQRYRLISRWQSYHGATLGDTGGSHPAALLSSVPFWAPLPGLRDPLRPCPG
jgi:adenosylmethionine-8-amino-7-oxononanoate aminotransferase